ncbi:MAG: hypothetical protein AAGD22_07135 [Verrucomicrobiota bacterium]
MRRKKEFLGGSTLAAGKLGPQYFSRRVLKTSRNCEDRFLVATVAGCIEVEESGRMPGSVRRMELGAGPGSTAKVWEPGDLWGKK